MNRRQFLSVSVTASFAIGGFATPSHGIINSNAIMSTRWTPPIFHRVRLFLQSGKLGPVRRIRAFQQTDLTNQKADTKNCKFWLEKIYHWLGESRPQSVTSTGAADSLVTRYEFENFTFVWESRPHTEFNCVGAANGCSLYGENGVLHLGIQGDSVFFPHDPTPLVVRIHH